MAKRPICRILVIAIAEIRSKYFGSPSRASQLAYPGSLSYWTCRLKIDSAPPPCFAHSVSAHAKLRLGILGSGKGSNMDAIAAACTLPSAPMEIALVLADVETAGILDKARARGIPAQYIEPGKFRTKLDDQSELRYVSALREARVDLIVLAGFMRILKGEILRAFQDRVVNIHPSLLPSFPGLEAWKQALEYGVKHTGCTVHFVDQGIDTGPILAQETVPVLDTDTAETLHDRIQTSERRLYPAVLAAYARGNFRVTGRRCLGAL
jgi:phosphoribosylglycinamide formyltransferase-1